MKSLYAVMRTSNGQPNELRIDAAGGDKAEASGQCAAASVLVERSRTQERPRLALIWNLKGAQSW
jgi:hypothetical protein